MKNLTSIVISNATTGNNDIHFRKTSFLTESNRTHLEECVRAFIRLPISSAYSDLVRMTCCPRKNISKALWEDIHLNPELIPEEEWTSFVNELRYQYKLTHPTFMTEFIVPAECLAAYDALASTTSAIAAYMFYKKADTFLCDHISSAIGQEHISDTFNRLTWHSRDAEINRAQKIKGLKRLSLKEYEALYFYPYLDKCITLLQSMQDYMLKDEQPSVIEPAEKDVSKYDDLPFIMGTPEDKEDTKTSERAYLELTKENILAYKADFWEFVFNNNEDSPNRLHAAGFDTNQVRSKAVAISLILRAHRDMIEAEKALTS